SLPKLLAIAKQKLKLRKPPTSIAVDGVVIDSIDAFWSIAKSGSLVVVSTGAVKQVSSKRTKPEPVISTVYLKSGAPVLRIQYATENELKSALQRPHEYYEGGELKGPLKGINFPTTILEKWICSVCRGVGHDIAAAGSSSRRDSVDGLGDSLVQISLNSQTFNHADDFRAMFSAEELRVMDAAFGFEHWTVDLSADRIRFPEVRPVAHLYVVAHKQGDRSTFAHEWAHAAFFLDSSYRAFCEALANADGKCPPHDEGISPEFWNHVQRELRLWGYNEDVLVDELQAYVFEGPDTVFGKRWVSDLRKLQHILRKELGQAPG
ncbi:hypothetical protein HDU82_000916, partial [Entophlyctis luteolus]